MKSNKKFKKLNFRQYDIDEGKALGLIHDLMRERPVYMLQALSNFGARLPNAA